MKLKLTSILMLLWLACLGLAQVTVATDPTLTASSSIPFSNLGSGPVQVGAPSNTVGYVITNTGSTTVYVGDASGNPSYALSAVSGNGATASHYVVGPFYVWSSSAGGSCTITPYLKGSPGSSLASLGSSFATNIKSTVDVYGSLSAGVGPVSWGAQIQRPQVYSPKSVVYYVSNSTANGFTSGSDSNNGTAISTPFLSITKALTQANSSNSGGDVLILVNTGTYASETSSRLILTGTFTQWCSVETYTGKTDVVVQDTASANGCINVRNSSVQHLQFKNITFTASGSNNYLFYYDPVSNAITVNGLHFVNCVFTLSASKTACYWTNTGSGDSTLNDVQFIGCSFPASGGQLFYTAPWTQTATNYVYNNIGMWDCVIPDGSALADFAGQIYGVNGFTVVGCRFSHAGLHGFMIGSDTSGNQAYSQGAAGAGTAPVPGCANVYIAGNYFKTTNANGHGLEIGNACTGAVAEYNYVVGNLHGVVVKGATNSWIRHNTVIVSGTAGTDALYAKASTNTYFLGNLAYLQGSSGTAYALLEAYDASSGILNSGMKAWQNYIIADGSHCNLVNWGNSSNSSGNGSANYNVYELRNSATWGTFRGTSVSSLATLQAAWISAALTGDNLASDLLSQLNSAADGTGTYADTVYAGGAANTGQTIYCEYVYADGRRFNGIGLEAYQPTAEARYMFGMQETSTSGTYARFVPFNLPAGNWTVLFRRQLGIVPTGADAVVNQTALAYNH